MVVVQLAQRGGVGLQRLERGGIQLGERIVVRCEHDIRTVLENGHDVDGGVETTVDRRGEGAQRRNLGERLAQRQRAEVGRRGWGQLGTQWIAVALRVRRRLYGDGVRRRWVCLGGD